MRKPRWDSREGAPGGGGGYVTRSSGKHDIDIGRQAGRQAGDLMVIVDLQSGGRHRTAVLERFVFSIVTTSIPSWFKLPYTDPSTIL